jgi:hypothetical protein
MQKNREGVETLLTVIGALMILFGLLLTVLVTWGTFFLIGFAQKFGVSPVITYTYFLIPILGAFPYVVAGIGLVYCTFKKWVSWLLGWILLTNVAYVVYMYYVTEISTFSKMLGQQQMQFSSIISGLTPFVIVLGILILNVSFKAR